MLFLMNGKSMELDNNVTSISHITILIDNFSSSSNMIFSHLKVDGIEIHENHEAYIKENIKNIKAIEAVFISIEEFVRELLVNAHEYLNNALPEMTLLSEEFYQGTNATTWNKLSQIVEGIQWLVQMIETINSSSEKQTESLNLTNEAANLIEILSTLEGAIKQTDVVLLGDMINYELKPLLETINSMISTIINDEVTRHELN